jgi:hypothetical protein
MLGTFPSRCLDSLLSRHADGHDAHDTMKSGKFSYPASAVEDGGVLTDSEPEPPAPLEAASAADTEAMGRTTTTNGAAPAPAHATADAAPARWTDPHRAPKGGAQMRDNWQAHAQAGFVFNQAPLSRPGSRLGSRRTSREPSVELTYEAGAYTRPLLSST